MLNSCFLLLRPKKKFVFVLIAVLLIAPTLNVHMVSGASSPTLTTDTPTNLTQTTATLNAQITNPNSAPITQRGFNYGPTLSYGQNTTESFVINNNFVYSSTLGTGTSGSADGQFNRPVSIAVNSSTSETYVVDANNKRIQKFDRDGNFISKWGSNGTGDNQFGSPLSVEIDSAGNVYVVDTGNHRIQKFDRDGNFISKWGSNGTANGQFKSPADIAIDTSNNIYIADWGNNRIQKFDSSGNFIFKWGSTGTGDGQMNGPMRLTLDTSGSVYVTEGTNNRVQKFDSSGAFIAKWGSNGTGDGQFKSPNGITTDYVNNVYVADGNNHRIQKFDSDGTFISTWGTQGNGSNQFNSPYDIVIDTFGNLFIADTNNHRVQKYSMNMNQGSFSTNLTGLTCNTTYHYRAYATNSAGTSNTADQTFVTDPCEPTLSIDSVSSLTDSSADINLDVTSDGGDSLSALVLEYGVSESYGHTEASVSPNVGINVVNLTGLTCNTTYHYRAYATNSAGTSNTTDQTFTTSACNPTLSVGSAYNTGKDSTNLDVNVSSDGGASLSSVGIEYGTTISYGSTKLSNTTNVGNNTTNLTGLTCNTTYHYRAYATNSAGTSNTADQTFTTNTCPQPAQNTPNTSSSSRQTTPSNHQTTSSVVAGSMTLSYFNYSNSVTPLVGDMAPKVYLSLPADNISEATVSEVEYRSLPSDGASQYPAGLTNFGYDTTPNASIIVNLYYDLPGKPTDYQARKYHTATGRYSTIEGASLERTQFNERSMIKLSYQLVDNGPLDEDPTLGRVLDPVGLASLTPVEKKVNTNSVEPSDPSSPEQKAGNKNLLVILLAIAAVVIGASLILLVASRKKERDNSTY